MTATLLSAAERLYKKRNSASYTPAEFFIVNEKKNREKLPGITFIIYKINLCVFFFHFCKTFIAENISALCRLERNYSIATATCTCCCESLSCRSCCVFTSITAVSATLGFILEAFFCIELLLAGGENKVSPAFLTFECFVFVHGFIPLLIYIAPVGIAPALCNQRSTLSYRAYVKLSNYSYTYNCTHNYITKLFNCQFNFYTK